MKVKRERPPMPPLAVKLQVVHRMLMEHKGWSYNDVAEGIGAKYGISSRTQCVHFGLWLLGFDKPCLDHDPALILRDYNPRIKDVAARYTPHAHDPAKLVYREKADHDQKTFGRKAGAERTVTTKGSDIWVKTKFARLEGRTKKRPKRPWPKGRKLQSRGFEKRRAP